MELIKINQQDGKQTVNARELHEFLGSKQEFSHWIKKRIIDYGFEKDKDFITIDKVIKREIGASRATEYHLSLDMAKELSMVERNAKGKQARQYFIDCEKQMQANQFQIPKTYAEALQLASDQAKELEEAKPKIEFCNRIENSVNAISVGEYANLLSNKGGIKIGQNRLFQFFYDEGYLMNSSRPYQKSINAGWFEVDKYVFTDQTGKERSAQKMLITGKGQVYFAGKLAVYEG